MSSTPVDFVRDDVRYRIHFMDDDIIRVRALFDRSLETSDGDVREESYTVIRTCWKDRLDHVMGGERTRKPPLVPEKTLDGQRVSYKTKKVVLSYDVSSVKPVAFEIRDTKSGDLVYSDLQGRGYTMDHMGHMIHYSKHLEGTKYLGCGECTGPMIKNGLRIRCDPKDAIGYDPESGGPMYHHVPFHIRVVPSKGNRKKHAIGVFYHTTRPCVMDMAREICTFRDARYVLRRADALTMTFHANTTDQRAIGLDTLTAR